MLHALYVRVCGFCLLYLEFNVFLKSNARDLLEIRRYAMKYSKNIYIKNVKG